MGFASSALVGAVSINLTHLAARFPECQAARGASHSPCCRPCNVVGGRDAAPVAREGIVYARVVRAPFEHQDFKRARKLLAKGVRTQEQYIELYDLFCTGLRQGLPRSFPRTISSLSWTILLLGDLCSEGAW